MKVKTAELNDYALDWAVELVVRMQRKEAVDTLPDGQIVLLGYVHPYSSDWAHGGPLLDQEGISTIRCDDDWGVDNDGFCNNQRIPVWCATTGQHGTTSSTEHQHHEEMYQIYVDELSYGPTKLVAGTRCFVAQTFGQEVDIPEKVMSRAARRNAQASSPNDEHIKEAQSKSSRSRPCTK